MGRRLVVVLAASALTSGLAVGLTAATASASAALSPDSSCVAQTIAFEGPPGPANVPAGYFGLDGIAASHTCG